MHYLENKWIAYDSSINEEIFNKIIKVLEDSGFEKRANSSSNNYEGFRRFEAISIGDGVWETYPPRSSSKGNFISVEEVLKGCKKESTRESKFPFKIGDVIRCDILKKWSSEVASKSPMKECTGKEATVIEIGPPYKEYISFYATVGGELYGMAYGGENLFTLVTPKNYIPTTSKEVNPILINVPKI